MIIQILAVITAASVISSLERSELQMSATLSVTQNHILEGYVISSQRTYCMMACAQRCLQTKDCTSFNFEDTTNGMCQLNSRTASAEANGAKEELSFKKGFVFCKLLNNTGDIPQPTSKPKTSFSGWCFTNLGAKGQHGPTSTTWYTGTPLQNAVTLKNGIQYWTIPKTGDYIISAYGASGANGTYHGSSQWNEGGLGALVRGTFHLNGNTKLKILVGQKGSVPQTSANLKLPGSGGGGTFVMRVDDLPLIIAGGGGGGGISLPGYHPGDPGQALEDGTRHGGTSGESGKLYQTGGGVPQGVTKIAASAGGGCYGVPGKAYPPLGTGGQSFENGGTGGIFPGAGANGGFGGGGFALDHPGGGGGYSGGGVEGNDNGGVAGGGGSYNSGSLTYIKQGHNKGDGYVVITPSE